MDGDLITSLAAASGSASLSLSSSINSVSQQPHHAGFKRGRDPSDDFALQLGQLAAPKLPLVGGGLYPSPGLGGGLGAGLGGGFPLLAPGMMPNGGSNLSPNSTNNNDMNESKKARIDVEDDQLGDGSHTRVVHIRNVANTVTEMEIIQLALPFGKVTNVLLLKNKNQAFLEFSEVNSAVTMVKFYNSDNVQPTLAGRIVYIQHSQHKELHTSGTHSNANAQTQAAILASQTVGIGGAKGGGDRVGNDPSPVLRVIVENMIYPITLETLMLIFKKYGPIQKIVTFTKNNTFQALIQYETSKNAEVAKIALNGQNIYNGCCNLRVDFSKMTNLSVRFNNDKSRDFTNSSLPTGDSMPNLPNLQNQGPSNAPGILAANPFAAAASGSLGYQHDGGFGGPKLEGAPTGPPPPFGPGMKHPQHPQHNGPPGGGGLGRGMPPMNNNLSAALQSLAALGANPQQAALLASLGLGGGSPQPGAAAVQAQAQAAILARLAGVQQNPMNPMNQMAAMGATGHPSQVSTTGSVLLVSSLPEGVLSTDDLFTLFGVYGDVIRVKILYNKKDNALIQMSDATQAMQVMHFLDKVKVHGKSIRVTASKHTTVQLPKEGSPDGGLTKDFSNSPLHRFKKAGSKNFANIFAPSATLHLSNIPPNVLETTLVEAFGEHGAVKGFKFFPKDHKMALIAMESVEEAVGALVKMHNYQLAEASHLRVSFSKSNIQM